VLPGLLPVRLDPLERDLEGARSETRGHGRRRATEEHVETAGLDVSEHGMWGYPEFYIPVPGGYGTESHGHLGLGGHHVHRPEPVPVPKEVPA